MVLGLLEVVGGYGEGTTCMVVLMMLLLLHHLVLMVLLLLLLLQLVVLLVLVMLLLLLLLLLSRKGLRGQRRRGWHGRLWRTLHRHWGCVLLVAGNQTITWVVSQHWH